MSDPVRVCVSERLIVINTVATENQLVFTLCEKIMTA